jgi:hypothetical protein
MTRTELYFDLAGENPAYEIMGGDLDSLSFYDGGPAYHLEDCATLEDARTALSEWREQNHAAWIIEKSTGNIVS